MTASRVCQVPGCAKVGRRICGTHAMRMYRHGTYDLIEAPSDEARFWSLVRPADADACWEWLGYKQASGHGQFSVSGRKVAPYRFAYELLRAEIPEGLTLDHLCGNPPCVNPWHLEPVPQSVNAKRYYAGLTACKHGHPFDDANTYIDKAGARHC